VLFFDVEKFHQLEWLYLSDAKMFYLHNYIITFVTFLNSIIILSSDCHPPPTSLVCVASTKRERGEGEKREKQSLFLFPFLPIP